MDFIKWILGSYFGLLFGIIILFTIVMMLLSMLSYFIQELVMKVQIRINTGFVSDGGKGSFWESVNLTEQQVNEFKNKQESLGVECNLEEFIVDDIAELVQHEIDNGKYGMFNY